MSSIDNIFSDPNWYRARAQDYRPNVIYHNVQEHMLAVVSEGSIAGTFNLSQAALRFVIEEQDKGLIAGAYVVLREPEAPKALLIETAHRVEEKLRNVPARKAARGSYWLVALVAPSFQAA